MRCWLFTWSLCLRALLAACAATAAADDPPPGEFGGESGSGMLETGELSAAGRRQVLCSSGRVLLICLVYFQSICANFSHL